MGAIRRTPPSQRRHRIRFFNPSRESSNSVESNDEVNSDVCGAGPTPSKGKGESITFIPGKHELQDKIRTKLLERSAATKGDGGASVQREEDREGEQLTPFQKYLEKRKAKRKERRRAARGGVLNNSDRVEDAIERNVRVEDEDDGMYGYDPEFGVAQFSDEEEGGAGATKRSSHKDEKKRKGGKKNSSAPHAASTKEELELLIAGDNGEFYSENAV